MAVYDPSQPWTPQFTQNLNYSDNFYNRFTTPIYNAYEDGNMVQKGGDSYYQSLTNPNQWLGSDFTPGSTGQYLDFGPSTGSTYSADGPGLPLYGGQYRPGYSGAGYYNVRPGYDTGETYNPESYTLNFKPGEVTPGGMVYNDRNLLGVSGAAVPLYGRFGWQGGGVGNHPGYAQSNYNQVLNSLAAAGLGNIDAESLYQASRDFNDYFVGTYGQNYTPMMNNYDTRSRIIQNYLARTGQTSTPGGQALSTWLNSQEYIDAGARDYYGPVSDFGQLHADMTHEQNRAGNRFGDIAQLAASIWAGGYGLGGALGGALAGSAVSLPQILSSINFVGNQSGLFNELGISQYTGLASAIAGLGSNPLLGDLFSGGSPGDISALESAAGSAGSAIDMGGSGITPAEWGLGGQGIVDAGLAGVGDAVGAGQLGSDGLGSGIFSGSGAPIAGISGADAGTSNAASGVLTDPGSLAATAGTAGGTLFSGGTSINDVLKLITGAGGVGMGLMNLLNGGGGGGSSSGGGGLVSTQGQGGTAAGGGLLGGGMGDLTNLINGILGYNNSGDNLDFLKAQLAQGQQLADPFKQYRGESGDLLMQSYRDPLSIYNGAGYQALDKRMQDQQLARDAQSGQLFNAPERLAQRQAGFMDYLPKYQAPLLSMSGANSSPNAANAFTAAMAKPIVEASQQKNALTGSAVQSGSNILGKLLGLGGAGGGAGGAGGGMGLADIFKIFSGGAGGLGGILSGIFGAGGAGGPNAGMTEALAGMTPEQIAQVFGGGEEYAGMSIGGGEPSYDFSGISSDYYGNTSYDIPNSYDYSSYLDWS